MRRDVRKDIRRNPSELNPNSMYLVVVNTANLEFFIRFVSTDLTLKAPGGIAYDTEGTF